jgi:two-component system cell cycle sensor histidine kinase/response regulator CckA
LPTGQESVLLVDDEPFIVDLGKQMLTRLGYRVVACTSSTEALELARKDPHRFDLVITDLTMPDMTGQTLADRLGRLRADLPVIMCSGYSDQMTSKEAPRASVASFVMKPFSIGALARTVRQVLDQSSGLGATHAIADIFRTSPN